MPVEMCLRSTHMLFPAAFRTSLPTGTGSYFWGEAREIVCFFQHQHPESEEWSSMLSRAASQRRSLRTPSSVRSQPKEFLQACLGCWWSEIMFEKPCGRAYQRKKKSRPLRVHAGCQDAFLHLQLRYHGSLSLAPYQEGMRGQMFL